MTETMCKHGFVWGTCPQGCKQTMTEPMVMPEQESEGLPPPPYTDKLSCVICGTEVEAGVVYKGKPVCNGCMKGMKGEQEE